MNTRTLFTTRWARPAARRPRATDRRRSARASLLCGAVAFVAASAGLAVALETVRPEWRDPEFGHRVKRLARVNEPVVLVVGTSRTQNAIAPAAMGGGTRAFNFGQSASTPLKHLLALRRVLDAGTPPAAVVVELFPPGLAVNGPADGEFRDRVARLSAGDFRHLAPYLTAPGDLRGDWLRARAAPWLAQRQVLMSHWAPNWQPWDRRIDFQWDTLDPHGFQPIAGVSPEHRERAWARARREYRDAVIGFHPGAESSRAVRDLVAVCRERSVPVAFFVPPISPAFRESFAPGVLGAAEAHLLKLAGELGVPVFPAPRDTTEDEFMDGHHMLRHGAERYSRWLADTHLTPWLTGLGVTR
ncbi:Uncharacterized protein OS=Singulisphaera acidiphila (strain ATCC BAA-1392 / DSM 18658 / VKM B-2454 / MOB10) GN=Sinac_5817 PE=4 SV=1 [Gemmataceae bacterium]|nr:Uncharacterized protein OS=Singulisphaera acidiphila (strain ATCC BAA-1392 / DSM 18658 / VKM B-2454 / MOB10) GN=Sinac_5817 PE=4 SV=1 [Gemmataceae bacterium]VTU00390.1 Uncharacterized protein OS=Singulisphaera acidiphila (strain ATCC BAA-1392 / DSM 18658 / VKM B-2454 / MOB10) GN=Sinac_5817 PE=4 SV=1 [Gemmataceae bacterium]